MLESYTKHLVNLMANENLTLSFSGSVYSAAMDMKARKIVVNSYLNDFSENVLAFERLLCHEVGHALFSSIDNWKELTKIFDKQLVNIFEDIRIENLLKQKFPGLRKLFSTGFYELDKLFGKKLKLSAIESLTDTSHFLDRLNVYFKSNFIHPVKFSEKELKFVEKLKSLEDQEKLQEILTEFLTEFNSQNNEKQTSSDLPFSSDLEFPDDLEETNDSGIIDTKSDLKDDSDVMKNSDLQQDLKETFSYKEQKTLDELKSTKIKDGISTVYSLNQPELNIITNSQFTKFVRSNVPIPNNSPMVDILLSSSADELKTIDKASTILFVEFERQKNAKNFRQQQHVKLGELNLNKLHQYKTATSIFKQTIVAPKQKNHEVIILLDWSGSIRTTLVDLIKESIIIAKFCARAKIPCSIYSFIESGSMSIFIHELGYDNRCRPWLVEMLSTNSPSFQEDCKNLIIIGKIVSNRYSIWEYRTKLRCFSLGGTPLHSTLLGLPTLIQSKLKSNKRICLAIISDGDSDKIGLKEVSNTTISPILHGTMFIDPLTKQMVHRYNNNQFLYDRLKIAFKDLSILTIHIADKSKNIFFCNGFINDLEEVSTEMQQQIITKVNNTGIYFGKFKNFDHMIIRKIRTQDEEDDDKKVPAKVTKTEATKMLRTKLHPMAKHIYSQIASSFA